MTTDDTLVPAELLAIMQCPACSGTLAERFDPPALVCASCGRAYPVRDGIPVMLVEESRRLDDAEFGRLMDLVAAQGIEPTFEQ